MYATVVDSPQKNATAQSRPGPESRRNTVSRMNVTLATDATIAAITVTLKRSRVIAASSRRRGPEHEREGRPDARFGRHGQLAVVRPHDVCGDREAETVACDVLRRTEEPFEHPLLVLDGDADAGVAHLDGRRLAVGGHREIDRAAVTVELDRVAEQVVDHLAEPAGVGVHGGTIGTGHTHLDHPVCSERAQGEHRLADDLERVDLTGMHGRLDRGARTARGDEDVGDDREQPLAAAERRLEVAPHPLRQIVFVEGQLEVAEHRGQGRAQLVRHRGHEVVARAQRFLLGRHIARHQHASRVGTPVIEQAPGGERQRDPPPLGILRPHGLVFEALTAPRPRERMLVRIERGLPVFAQQHAGVGGGVQPGHRPAQPPHRVVLVHDVAAHREAHHTEVDRVEHFGHQLLLLHGGGAGEGEPRSLRVEQLALSREAPRRPVPGAADRDDHERQQQRGEAEHGRGPEGDHRPVEPGNHDAARDQARASERGEPHRGKNPQQTEPAGRVGHAQQRDREDVDDRHDRHPAGRNARPRHGERRDAAESDDEGAEGEQLGALEDAAHEPDHEHHRDDPAQQQLVGRGGTVTQVESLRVAPRTPLGGERGAVGGRPSQTLHTPTFSVCGTPPGTARVQSVRAKADRGRGPKATTPVERMLRISDPRASRAEPRAPRRRRGCRHRRGRR